ncbi:MAG: regulatory protein RecX [Eggerthellaceae bacterium]
MRSIEQEPAQQFESDELGTDQPYAAETASGKHRCGIAKVPHRGTCGESEGGRFPSGLSMDGRQDEEDPCKQAYNRIVYLCGYNEFSREKMRKRLKREKIRDEVAEDALDRAVACGLIDDIRYGEALCAGRMRSGKGRQGIEAELWENGIDPASIEGWPQEYEERYGSELSRALKVIESHPPRSKRPRDSAYRRLIGKGFSPGVASDAAGTWWRRQQERAEGE